MCYSLKQRLVIHIKTSQQKHAKIMRKACEEERFNRKKHTQEFPTLAINECLKKAGITINDVNEIGFIFDPILIIKEKYLKLALEDERKIKASETRKLQIEEVRKSKESELIFC